MNSLDELFPSNDIRRITQFLFGQIRKMEICKYLHRDEYGVGVMYSEGDYGYEARQYYGCNRNQTPKKDVCLLWDHDCHLENYHFECPFAQKIIEMAKIFLNYKGGENKS